MTLHAVTFPTPLGPFSIALDANFAVLATAFGPLPALQDRLKKCHVIRDTPPDDFAALDINNARLCALRKRIDAYFAGSRHAFPFALRALGSPFQQRVWSALQRIHFGETQSYGRLARELGTSARAVGRASATNPICLLIPCHRVIGADGSLTGFAFGEDIKRRLLEHEGVNLA
jgi:methylated-DNA-[protein]-cysteine S-methyltransferase